MNITRGKKARHDVAHILTYASAATAALAGRGTFGNDTFAPSRPAGDGAPLPAASHLLDAPHALGTLPIRADKIGFYVVPDIDATYLATANATDACRWGKLLATFQKMKRLLPEVQLRWDNELGHGFNNASFVEDFVSCANASTIPMIITASAVDGYNNYWASNNTQPSVTIQDIADGPYLAVAHDLMQRYSNVPWVETINEVDGMWFVADPDNVTGFDLYMDQALATFGPDADRLLGPATAFRNSRIYDAYLTRPNVTDISYHNYLGAQSLTLVPGKTAWITEYGGPPLTPAGLLGDCYGWIQNGILAASDPAQGTIGMLYYNQLTDNGGNRGAFNNAVTEGDHFAFRDWFRALTLLRAAAEVSPYAYSDATGDYIATDDGQGGFAALMWNNFPTVLSNGTRSIFGVSLSPSTPLFVTTVVPGDDHTASCAPLASQQTVGLSIVDGNTAVLQPRQLVPAAATLVSTQPCDELAD